MYVCMYVCMYVSWRSRKTGLESVHLILATGSLLCTNYFIYSFIVVKEVEMFDGYNASNGRNMGIFVPMNNLKNSQITLSELLLLLHRGRCYAQLPTC